MRELFTGFYPSDAESISLESSTLVIFDANVLLGLYRYPESASRDLIRLMEGLSERVWLPYQAALEYQRNRLTVIADQKKRFKEVEKAIEEGITAIENKLDGLQLRKRHSTIDVTEFLESIKTARNRLSSELNEKERVQLDVRSIDTIRDKLDAVFSGKVGGKPTQEWLDQVAKSGEARYKAKIPPGYKDQDKTGDPVLYGGLSYQREYGDLVLWRQIVEHCNTIKPQQVVFVTDDDKEDWWLIVQSSGARRISPRIELVEELTQESGVSRFVMMSSEQFASRFSQILEVAIANSTVVQVRDIQSTLFEVVDVICPSCSCGGTCALGSQAGSSSMHSCESCDIRFHVNRGGDGKVITREWGGSTKLVKHHRVTVICPTCDNSVAANLRSDEVSSNRYCMNCCSLIEIGQDGSIHSCMKSHAIPASSVKIEDGDVYLRCPECVNSKAARTLWNDDKTYRAVCPTCRKLLESNFISEID